jgi:plastocyanin domain-containing protein
MKRIALFTWVAVAALAAGCAGQQASNSPARHDIAVGETGYSPARIEAKAGQEVVLVFTRTTEQTCGTEVVIPSENRTIPLPLNQPVEVHLTPSEKGEIQFTCGMKMFQGVVEVN